MQQSQTETVNVGANTAGRILVVEDDEALSYAWTRILAVGGYDSVAAHDYREALRILEDGGRVDLMLSDLRLPDVNGFALARMARMRHRGLKVVYVTGHDDIPAHEALGPVLRKPCDQDTLLDTIRTMLADLR